MTVAPVAAPRRGGRRRAVLLVTAAVLVVAVVAVVAVSSASGSGPTVRLAPFSLPRLGPSGANHADPVRYPLPRAQRDRPVVLAFFASWCVLCRSDLPVVAAVARTLTSSSSE